MNETTNLEIDASSLDDGLRVFSERALQAIEVYCETSAQDLENYMKEYRVWTDRTGQARQRLTCTVESTDEGYRLALAQGVDYGLWLELAKEKRFAILEPTVRLKGPEVVRGFNGLVDRLRGL